MVHTFCIFTCIFKINDLVHEEINAKKKYRLTGAGICTHHGAPPILQFNWMAILVAIDMRPLAVIVLNRTTWDGAEKVRRKANQQFETRNQGVKYLMFFKINQLTRFLDDTFLFYRCVPICAIVTRHAENQLWMFLIDGPLCGLHVGARSVVWQPIPNNIQNIERINEWK